MKQFKITYEKVQSLKVSTFIQMLFLLFLVNSLEMVEAHRFPSENVFFEPWNSVGRVKTCFMKWRTSINSKHYTISTHCNTIEALNFSDNKKISYLPVYVGENFPNLLVYDASSCTIKEISNQNFKSFRRLKQMFLENNQIEMIQNEAFDELTNLELLWLGERNVTLVYDFLFLHVFY